MIQLDPAHYDNVRPLFHDLALNLVVPSILDGNTIGRVYADHAERPQTALIWNQMDTLLLAGDTANDAINRALRWLLLSSLMPDARARGVPGFTLYPGSAAWVTTLSQIAPGLAVRPLPRRAFHLARLKVAWHQALPPAWEMQSLDGDFLARSDWENMTVVHGWIHSFWPTLDTFTRHGLGFALTGQESVAAWCLSVYKADGELELGVETAVPFRGQGLATLAAAACLEQCLARGIKPHWQCNRDNLPSLRVAEKLGFVPERDYTAYWLPFPDSDDHQAQR